MTLEDKLDCVECIDIVLKDSPQTNIRSIFELIKKNSACYACPENNGECIVERVNELYLMQQASRGVLRIGEVQPNYDLVKWLEDKGEEPLGIGAYVPLLSDDY